MAAAGTAACFPRHRARRAVADPVGADRHRHDEIRAPPAARRQQRGGRNALAHRARVPRAWAAYTDRFGCSASSARRCSSGSSLITPAISVLSAVEGLKLVAPAFEPYVLPLTIVILVALFAVQSHGTARVAALFGPIMVVWFVAIAIAGRHSYRRRSRRVRSDQSALRHQVPVDTRRDRPDHARRGVPGRHRRRGAVCRPRPFRPQADPDRLAQPGPAGAADQLLRPGRAGARQSGRDR